MTIAKEPAAPTDDLVLDAPAREQEDASLERLLEHVPAAARPAEPAPVTMGGDPPYPLAQPALRTARVIAVRGRQAEIAYRGRATATAAIDEGVDPELVKRAMAGNEAVLVEVDPEVGPVVVGVVQTRLADVVEIKARKVVLDADEELVMRAGRGAMRIREDGDVELVGSRISTLSRGLFRIVGRVLRLN